MDKNIIYNEDCFETMRNHIDEKSIDVILTSPPYLLTRHGKNSKKTVLNAVNNSRNMANRYDIPIDYIYDEEKYLKWLEDLFISFDKILKTNGVILFNISYTNDSKQFSGYESILKFQNMVVDKTPFTITDMITWKKSSVLPNNTSPNKLTRITEPVFVIVRKNEVDTFVTNKKVNSVSKKGQNYYSPIYNFIEAKNNDGSIALNKATYSTELCLKLLDMYARIGSVVYDPFIGTGTTGVACKKIGIDYIGSELSKEQCDYADKRINAYEK